MYNLQKNTILRPTTDPISIKALEGDVFLRDVQNHFSGFDNGFSKFRSKNFKTPAIQCQVWQLEKKKNFIGMFESFQVDIKSLVLTEHQIVEFADCYGELFGKSGDMTFFLLESSNTKANEADAFAVPGFGFSHAGKIPHAQLYPYQRSNITWYPHQKVQIVIPHF